MKLDVADAETVEYARRIRDYLAHRDELLNDTRYAEMPHPLAGHCYVASEALYYLTGGPDRWTPESVKVTFRDPKSGYQTTTTHWYLRERESGAVVDLTSDQFPEEAVDIDARYEAGQGRGFVPSGNGGPSKRAQQVIEVVRNMQPRPAL